tara:strand:- start:4 stop:1260 length:1257 start_codon:yes stop_codon:yes gene_type:complete
MAKKKEEPTVDNEVGKLKVKEKVEKQPDSNETKDNVTKVITDMKKPAEDIETITKVDLSKPLKKEEDAVQEQSTDEVSLRDESKVSEEVLEEIIETTDEKSTGEGSAVQDEKPAVEEVANEEVQQLNEEVVEAIRESEENGRPIPESIGKLLDFMEETGGDLSDYVSLNKDYTELDNNSLLKEYYKKTKPHLSEDEIEFIMEDKFSFDEEEDEKVDIKRKKLALKEQVAEAKQHLESVKSKYYEDIKAGSKLTTEQQKAIDFFNRYNKESEESLKMQKNRSDVFVKKSNQVFNEDFKGFEYKVGDKKFRLNVKDVNAVKDSQSDINNFVKKFLNKENYMEDATGYHRSLFTAMNPDMIANHFYEQGKADALKDSMAESKNIDMTPRQSFMENTNTSGFTARVLNDDGPDFKFKIKNKN